MAALTIRKDRTPVMLRKLAKAEEDARVGRRMLAIANALDGMSREEAAQAAGMDRQTLRDWVIRYNENGIDGLPTAGAMVGRHVSRRNEQAELYAIVLDGPDPETAVFRLHARGPGAISARSGSARPMHRWSLGSFAAEASRASRDRRRARATRKKTRPPRRPLKRAPQLLKKIQHTHKNKRIRLFFQDEARIGQKGRTCHVWWKRGERPPGLCDKRFTFAYIFAAVEPGTDNAFALVMPYANTEAMQVFLDRFAATIGEDEHVAMVLDQAGWHGAARCALPATSRSCRCRPTRPSSTRSSACGTT